MPHPFRWMLAVAGCAAALAAVRAPAADAAPSALRPQAAADTSCSPYEPAPTPAELGPFITDGKQPLCAAAADLDGDGRQDYVLVLGTQPKHVWDPDAPEPGPDEILQDKDDLRTLLVLVRQPDGALRVAARTERAVMCAECGGIFGDPFEGVSARPGEFTLNHYGGSAWRWRADYTFRYAPAARRWRLASVASQSFWTLEPEKVEEHVHTSPEDFAAIDLEAFDYETWRGPDAEK
jgi:hypothetical protein